MADNPASMAKEALDVTLRHPVRVLGAFLLLAVIVMVLWGLAVRPASDYTTSKLSALGQKAKSSLSVQGTSPSAPDATTRGI